MKATHPTKDRQIIVQQTFKRKRKPVRRDVIDETDLLRGIEESSVVTTEAYRIHLRKK